MWMILALLGAGVLAAFAVYGFLGGYWYQLMRGNEDDE